MAQRRTSEAFASADSLLQCAQYLTEVEEGVNGRLGSMVYTDVAELQATLAAIDIKLKFIANTTKPMSVNKLPNAILMGIFQYVKLPVGSAGSPFPPQNLKWVVVTHVCTHWRRLALSTASLWADILLHTKGGATLADAFISRSGDLPLTVVLGSGVGNKTSIPMIQSYCRILRRVVAAASHRISKLVVEPGFPIDDVLRADNLGRKLSAELEQVLPTILRKNPSIGSKRHPPSDDPLFTFFHSPTARLTHLELCGGQAIAHALQSGTFLQHLEVLHLSHADEDSQAAEGLAMSSVFTLLSASKSTLRKLTLVGVPFLDRNTSIMSSRGGIPIALDRLENLEMGDWLSNEVVTTFLSNLLLPRTAGICLWADVLEEASSCEFYPHFLVHPEEIRCVVLASVPGGDMLALRNGVLFINGAIPFFTFSSLLAIPLLQVDKLIISSLINPLTIEEWCLLFKHLPNIHLIEIRDADPGRLLRALRLERCLPHLTELDLQYSDKPYSEEELDPLGMQYATEPPGLGALLYSVASQRHSRSSASDAHPPARRLERVFIRFDSRVRAVEDWELELDAIVHGMRECVGSVLFFKRKWGLWDASAQESERRMEMDNKWHLSMKPFQGLWPTKAVYFKRFRGVDSIH